MNMAQPSKSPFANPNIPPVISPQFCAPYPVELAIVREFLTNFVVTDGNGNFMFKVKGPVFSFCDKRVLVNNARNPIITLRPTILSAHSRWQVFRGDSSDSKDLLFSAKTSLMLQLNTKLDVFLANNTAEEVCDFKVKGSRFGGSCVIYAGESSNIVAQVHNKHSVQSVLLGNNKFMVTVYPHVDQAFIVALVVILYKIASGN